MHLTQLVDHAILIKKLDHDGVKKEICGLKTI